MLVARTALVVLLLAWVSGCSFTTPPPKRQADICQGLRTVSGLVRLRGQVRAQVGHAGAHPHGLRAPRVQLPEPRPAARRWLWFIPLGRPSSAKGYAQAQDPVWGEYQAERGRLFRSRSDMEDALDFIGWYNDKTWRQLGISRTDAEQLYLAYHEGRGGYRRGTWKKKPKVQRTARNVAATAASTAPSSPNASRVSAATPGTRSGRCAADRPFTRLHNAATLS